MGGVMGSALAKCGSKPQASKLIKSSLFASVSCGGAVGIARTPEGGGGDWLKSSRPHTPLTARRQAGLRGVFCPNSSPFFPQLDQTSPMPRSLVIPTRGPNAGLAGAPRPSEDGARGRARAAERRGRISRGRESRPGGLRADSNIPVKVSGSSRPDHLAPRSEKVKGVSGSPAPPSGRPLHALLPPARGR